MMLVMGLFHMFHPWAKDPSKMIGGRCAGLLESSDCRHFD